MKKMKISFQAKMLLPVLLTVIIAFIITGVSVYVAFKKEVSVLAETNAWNIAEISADTIGTKFNDAITVTSSLAGSAKLISEGDLDENNVFGYMFDMAAKYSDFYSLYIIWDEDKFAPAIGTENNKKVRITLDPDTMAGSDWYDNPINSDGTAAFISKPFYYDYGNGPINVVSVTRAFSVNDEIAGVVGVDISADTIFDFTSAIKVYETGYVYLMSMDHVLLAHPRKELVGQVSSHVNNLKDKTPSKESFAIPTKSLTTGKVVQNLYKPVTLQGADEYYYIGVSVPMDEMLASVYKVRVIVSVIAVLAMLIIAVVVYMLVRGLMRMLGGEPQNVINSINEIADGNFALDVKLKPNDSSSLMYHIKDMAGQLRNIITESMNISEELRSASASLSAGAQELSSGMAEQAGQADQISSAAVEMNATTSDIAKNLEGIAEFTNDTSHKVDSGVSAVEDSLQEIVKIKDMADKASVLAEGLEEKSSEISNIIDAITSIADQTNLLALNAAIEAARAGDAGRGFAVVADEVRKLAEKTQQSTNEISRLVTDVRKEVSNVTSSMLGVTEQVDEGVRASQDISAVLKEIDDVVMKLKDMINSISGATQEMSSTSEQIQQDISGIAVVSSQVSTTTGHLAENATTLDSVSETLRNMMMRFKI